MEKFKIDNFIKEYKEKLIYLELSKYELNKFERRIKDEYELIGDLSLMVFWNEFESNTINFESTYELPEIFDKLGFNISNESIIYVVWDFQKIDIFKYMELCKYWDDIWYDTSDELVLLYVEGNSLLITDYGEIRYKRTIEV